MDDQEAIKALQLAQKYDAAGNTESALKWVRKSLAISPSPAARQLLDRLERGGSSATSSSTASNSTEGLRSRTNGAAKPGGSPESSSKPAPAQQRTYTTEQVTIVKRVRSAGGDFYKVLEVEKTAEDNVIKKAYRKLALQLHPDKNGAPGADEAFKIVSKAFTVLSDSDKRAAYDRFGGDPDSRFGSASAAAGGRDPRFHAGGMGEVDPQELFNMFFGGGGMGGGGATFQFGGPGMQFRSFGGGHPAQRRAQAGRRQQQQQQTPENANVLLQLLPLLILALFSLLSYAPALFSTSDPSYAFAPSGPHREQRFTPANGVSYYVEKNSFRQHPFVTGESKSNGGLAGFENRVETRWKNTLYDQCQQIREYQSRRLQNTQGFFGIGADPEAAARIRAERHEPCERLRDFGILM